ncbi:MAG: DUF6455 family protein [Paracoccaceae bacterium]
MTDHSNIKQSASRVDQMAAVRGIDLEEAVMTGDMDFGEIADAVLRCQNCSNPDHCQSWMTARTEGADRSPEYCWNNDLFSRLLGQRC